MKTKNLRPGTLAQRNIRRHKKRYAAMAASIILALLFASGLIYFGYSYQAATEAMICDQLGREDEILMHTNKAYVDDALARGDFTAAGYAHLDGQAQNGTSVAWLDDEARRLANHTLLSGTWPEKEDEIAIEQTALTQMGLQAEVGDTITVNMLVQNGSALLDKTVEKTYVLTGILKDKRLYMYRYLSYSNTVKTDMPAAFVCTGTQTEPGGRETLACYVTCSTDSTQKKLNIFNDLIYQESDAPNGYAVDILNTSYNIRYADGYRTLLNRYRPTAILTGVLLFAACAAVVNAFNTNLQARKKQIGLLRAVGATKGQIIKMYGIEVLLIALLCVPVSLLITFFAVRAAIGLMGSEYIFMPNLWVLLLCGLFGLLCVLLAALIPLVGATRISPMQAIRNITATRRMRTKHIRTKKAFCLPKLLAARRTALSKGRQVVVSLFLTIAIIGSGYILSYGAYQLEHLTTYSYDYMLTCSPDTFMDAVNLNGKQTGFTESDRQTVLRLPYIESSTGQKICRTNLLVDTRTDYLNMTVVDQMYNNIDIVSGRANELTGSNYRSLLWSTQNDIYTAIQPYIPGDYLPVTLLATDNATLEKLTPYLDSGAINTDRLDTGEEVILIAPAQIGLYVDDTDAESGFYSLGIDLNEDAARQKHSYFASATRDSGLIPGQTLALTSLFASSVPNDGSLPDDIETRQAQTQIGAVLSQGPPELESELPQYSRLYLLTSIDGMEKLAGNIPYETLKFTLNEPCTEELDQQAQSVLDTIAAPIDTATVSSNYALRAMQQDDVRNLLTIALSVVILLFVFCGTIVNNTITADIRENRRELGTLRAVGASAKELSEAYIRQLLRMLGWGNAIGFAGFGLSYLAAWLFCRLQYGPGNFQFTFMPWGSLLFCAALLGICSLNLYLKIKKETKHSIVDNIREL